MIITLVVLLSCIQTTVSTHLESARAACAAIQRANAPNIILLFCVARLRFFRQKKLLFINPLNQIHQ